MNRISLNTKQVGYILVLISVLLGGLVWQYTNALNARNALLHESCTLPENVCPFKQSIPAESLIGAIISAFLFLFGVFLIITYRDVTTVLKEKSSKIEKIAETLKDDERKVYDTIVGSEGAAYQHDIVTKTELSKVKVTRILDMLEARGLVERKRRGMSNLVVLKHF